MIRKVRVCWIEMSRLVGVAVVAGVLATGCDQPPADENTGAGAPEPPTGPLADPRSGGAARWTGADDQGAAPSTVVRRVGADLSGPLKPYTVDKTQDDVRVVVLEMSRTVIFAQARDPLLTDGHEAGMYATPALTIRYLVEFRGQDTLSDYSATVDRLTVGNVPLESHPEVAPGEVVASGPHENTTTGGFRAPRVGNPTRAAIRTSTFRGVVPAAETVDVTIRVVKNGQEIFFDFPGLPL